MPFKDDNAYKKRETIAIVCESCESYRVRKEKEADGWEFMMLIPNRSEKDEDILTFSK